MPVRTPTGSQEEACADHEGGQNEQIAENS
jgi:hypothetical protein